MDMNYSYEENWLLGMPAIGLELGGYFGGGYLAKHYPKKAIAQGVKVASFGGIPTPGGSPLAIKARARMASYKSLAGHAKNIRGAAMTLGFVGLFAVGFSMFESLVGTTGTYQHSKRYSPTDTGQGYTEESYFDSRAAFTQRQRALMVIHNSQLGNRAAFGQEAQFLHS